MGIAPIPNIAWPVLQVLVWACGIKAMVHLQLGDKCMDDKTKIFPTFDDNESVGVFGKEGTQVNESLSLICDPGIPLVCLAGRCQCKKGYTINRNATKCLEVARNGMESVCEENIQCWKSLMGRMSECNMVIGRCQCQESEALPIVFHNGRCEYGESLGEYCKIDGLCEATTPNATCRSDTCQCREGFVPSWDKSHCLPIAVGLDSSCEENIQCEKSQLGTLSECNQETMKCNCYKIPDMEAVFHEGRCYFESALGDVCQVGAQCQKKTPNSECSRDGKCRCEDGYIPNGNNTLCLAIPSGDSAVLPTTAISSTVPSELISGKNISSVASGTNNGDECNDDVQCFRLLGPLSRCSPIKRKCECYVPENLQIRMGHFHDNSVITSGSFKSGKPDSAVEFEQLEASDSSPNLVIVGGRCYLSKYLGQLCKFNKQCSAITENSWCDNGRCECLEETHVRSEDGRKCLKIAQKGLDSVCDEDGQCNRSALGQLSRCNVEKKRCECSNSIMPVVFYRGKCYFHRQLGSSCESNVECQAGSNYLAECNLGRCRCQNGTIRFSAHVCGFNSSSLRNIAPHSFHAVGFYGLMLFQGILMSISFFIFSVTQ